MTNDMFDKNFFPTPKDVITKMLQPYHSEHRYGAKLERKYILEPSAGKGDILDYLRDCSDVRLQNLYCIEKNSELQTILTGKGYKLIGDDFLEYSGEYDFDLIVMNPPFDEGDKHLLKAWELIGNGDVVCLLNAETIRNPYTRTRQLLKEIIDENGTVEFLGDCFSSAERKTNVDVVLVRLSRQDIRSRFDFGTMESEHLEFSEDLGKELATGNVIKNIILHYEESKELFREALQRMEKMNQSMKFLTGEYGINVYDKIDKYGTPQDKYHGFLDDVKMNIWLHIVEQLKIEKYMTNRVRNDFISKIRNMGNMAINEQNIKKVVAAVIQNSGSILEQNVVDVFDLFTKYYKENRCHVEGWKTNDRWKVNKKVILPYYIKYYNWETTYHVDYGRMSEFADIEKCMCYLTGKKYENICFLDDRIKQVTVGDSSVHTSEFFDFRCYKKGTIHLYFKDEWLWKEFSMRACAGKNWLPEAEKKEWQKQPSQKPLSLF